MSTLCLRFFRDDGGATAIEYGLIVSCIALGIMAAIDALSTSVRTMLFDVIVNAVST